MEAVINQFGDLEGKKLALKMYPFDIAG